MRRRVWLLVLAVTLAASLTLAQVAIPLPTPLGLPPPFKLVEVAIYAGGFIVGGVIWYLYELIADGTAASSVSTHQVQVEQQVTPAPFDATAAAALLLAFNRYAEMGNVVIADVDDIPAIAFEARVRESFNRLGADRSVLNFANDINPGVLAEPIAYPFIAFEAVAVYRNSSQQDALNDIVNGLWPTLYRDALSTVWPRAQVVGPMGFTDEFARVRSAGWFYQGWSRWWLHRAHITRLNPWWDTYMRNGFLNNWWYDYRDLYVFLTRQLDEPLRVEGQRARGFTQFINPQQVGLHHIPWDKFRGHPPLFGRVAARQEWAWSEDPWVWSYLGSASAIHFRTRMWKPFDYPAFSMQYPYPYRAFLFGAVPFLAEFELDLRQYACEIAATAPNCPHSWIGPSFLRVEAVVPIQVTLDLDAFVPVVPYVPHYGDPIEDIWPFDTSVYRVTEIKGLRTAVYVEMLLPARVVAGRGAAPVYSLWASTFYVSSGRELTAYTRVIEEWWRGTWLSAIYGIRAPGIDVTVPPMVGALPWDATGAPDEGIAFRERDGALVWWVVNPAQAFRTAFIPTVGLADRFNATWATLQTRFPFSVAASLTLPAGIGAGVLSVPAIEFAGLRIAADDGWLGGMGDGIRLAGSLLLVVMLVMWVRGKFTPRTVI